MAKRLKIVLSFFFLQFAIAQLLPSPWGEGLGGRCSAQSVSPFVIGSAGNESNNGSIFISSSVGEAIVTTVSSPTLTLTQGFEQTFASCPVLSSLTVTPNTTICAGDNITVSPNISGGAGPFTYSWSSGQTTSTINVSPTITTAYTFTVSTSACTKTASVTVTVNQVAPTLSASKDSICIGDMTTLTAGGGTTYLWSPGGQTANVISVNPAGNTNYIVTVTNTTGCTATDTLTISVSAPPVPGITASNQTFCLGQTTTLTATGGNTYNWANGPPAATNVVTPLSSGNNSYTVTVSIGSCSADTFITVNVNPLPPITALASKNNICPGDSVNLSVSGGLTYAWSTGATAAAITVFPAANITYTVTGFDNNNCSNTALETVSIDSIVVNAGPDITICPGFTANLSAQVTSTLASVIYLWTPGSLLNDSTQQNVSATIDSATTFTVTVSNGLCSAKDSVTVYTIRTTDCVIHVYNGITPNADNNNDIWIIDGISAFPKNSVEIFDRWGAKVWSGSGYNNKTVVWKGNNQSGQELPDGTYYYMIKLFDTDGSVLYSGSKWVEVTR